MSDYVEINFDGLVGPTHNYAGLAFGNIASQQHAQHSANPREAALQGLQKMRLLMQLGVTQAVLPPQPRPDFTFLHRIGFHGEPQHILARVVKEAPQVLPIVYSASNMWTANAATLAPSQDTADGKVHITPANLIANAHRRLEWPHTQRVLKTIFADPNYFVHHDPLPGVMSFADEGAANHTRLCAQHGSAGLHFFVYARQAQHIHAVTKKFPPRQTDWASQAIARLHTLPSSRVIYAQQNPQAIDAGVFHNDVIAVGNEHVLLYHEHAFANTADVIARLEKSSDFTLTTICVPADNVSLTDAVATYLFNSQLVTLSHGNMALIAPQECAEHKKVAAYINELIAADNPITAVHYVDCRQSMHNGGGPACLRLRAVLNAQEKAALHAPVLLTKDRLAQLETWVKTHYRDRLAAEDLRDPQLIQENITALTALEKLFALDGVLQSLA